MFRKCERYFSDFFLVGYFFWEEYLWIMFSLNFEALIFTYEQALKLSINCGQKNLKLLRDIDKSDSICENQILIALQSFLKYL